MLTYNINCMLDNIIHSKNIRDNVLYNKIKNSIRNKNVL